MTTRRTWPAQTAAGAALPGIPWAADAPCPVKPVTLVIAFSAGGPTDTLGRILAEQLERTRDAGYVAEYDPIFLKLIEQGGAAAGKP